jgi:hypothetical protein
MITMVKGAVDAREACYCAHAWQRFNQRSKGMTLNERRCKVMPQTEYRTLVGPVEKGRIHHYCWLLGRPGC